MRADRRQLRRSAPGSPGVARRGRGARSRARPADGGLHLRPAPSARLVSRAEAAAVDDLGPARRGARARGHRLSRARALYVRVRCALAGRIPARRHRRATRAARGVRRPRLPLREGARRLGRDAGRAGADARHPCRAARPGSHPRRGRLALARPRGAALRGAAGAGATDRERRRASARDPARGSSASVTSRIAAASKRAVRFAFDWRVWVGVAIPVAAVLYTVHDVDLREVATHIGDANVWLVLAMVPLHVLALYLRALRWRWLGRSLSEKPLPIGPRFRATGLGVMAINGVPFRLGELARPWL